MEWRDLKVLAAYLLGVTQQASAMLAVLIVASLGTALATVLLGLKVDPRCFWGLLLLLPLAGLSVWMYGGMRGQRALDHLQENWGKEQSRRRNFSMIDALHRYRQASEDPSDTSIDDQTWNDLNMNAVYEKLDRTLTNPGECVLYRMLRTPLLSDSELRRRSEVIRLFQTDQIVRERVQLDLQRLGRWETNVITALVWEQTPPATPLKYLYSSLALLALIVAIGAPLLWGSRGIAAIVVVYVVNLLATRPIRARLAFAIAAMRYQSAMIRTAQRIASLAFPALAPYVDHLQEAGRATSLIARKTLLLLPESSFSSDLALLLYAHLDIYFLRNVRLFHAVMHEMNQRSLPMARPFARGKAFGLAAATRRLTRMALP